MAWNANIDWTSADTIRPTLERQDYLVLYDLAEAVRERMEVIERSPLALDPIARGDRPGRIFDIDDEFEALFPYYSVWFPRFVNQTDNSGNWNDESSIPVWTLADMETYIGSAKPDPVMGGRPSAAWAYWLYTALNLLLWTKQQTGIELDSGQTGRYKDNGLDDTSWPVAVSDFNAASWGAWASGGAGGHSAVFVDGVYKIKRTAWRVGALEFYGRPATQSFSIDYYVRLICSAVEDNDYGTGSGNLARVYTSDTIFTTSVPAGTVEVGNIDTVTLSEPTSGERGWSRDTRTAFNFQVVRRFDVTGGFDYVA